MALMLVLTWEARCRPRNPRFAPAAAASIGEHSYGVPEQIPRIFDFERPCYDQGGPYSEPANQEATNQSRQPGKGRPQNWPDIGVSQVVLLDESIHRSNC